MIFCSYVYAQMLIMPEKKNSAQGILKEKNQTSVQICMQEGSRKL